MFWESNRESSDRPAVSRRSVAMRTAFTGVGTAVVTPFTKSGALDEAAVRRLGRRQIDAGIHFLCPCGTTGENPTLTDDERRRIVEILVDEAKGAVPILAGAGGYDTKEVIHLAALMQKAGAAGLLSVTPYYNKPTQEGLYLSLIHISEPTRLLSISYAVFCLKKKKIEKYIGKL